MFNRGITNSSHKGIKTTKTISSTKSKSLDKNSDEDMEITPDSTPASTPASTSTPNSPSVSLSSTTSTQEIKELIEPEPKIVKPELGNTKSSLDLIKEQRQLHRKRGGLKEEDKIVLYTKNLPPIIGFKHDEIPLPSWEIHNENESNVSTTKRKHKNEKEEIVCIN